MPYEMTSRMGGWSAAAGRKSPTAADCGNLRVPSRKVSGATGHGSLAAADSEDLPVTSHGRLAATRPQGTPTGSARPLLVNRSHPIPRGYRPNLVSLEDGRLMDAYAADAARRMLDACRASGLDPRVTSAWRPRSRQTFLLARKVIRLLGRGLSPRSAWDIARRFVAPPGTSEHELGLALDICSARDDVKAHARVQAWLAAHSWQFGFIRRYPADKSHITGINHEPWHVRYVGLDVAREMHQSGECLEEYVERTQ